MRKSFAWAVVCLVVAVGMVACGGGGGSDPAPAASTANVTGTWSVTVKDSQGDTLGTDTFALSQSGTNVTGTRTSDNATLTGTVSGTSLTLSWQWNDGGNLVTTTAVGTVNSSNNQITGTWSETGANGQWSATKQ